jgi:hypothetical protein
MQGNAGCSMFRAPDPPIDQKIAIQSRVERDGKGRLDGDLKAYSTLKGVLVGTATGLPSGGFTGGSIAFGAGFLACGTTAFLWPLCVFAATVTGAVIGGIVGLFGGGIIGFVGGLPSKTADQVTEALSHLEDGRRFEDDLQAAVEQAVPKEQQASADETTRILTARLDSFDLRQHSKDRLSIRLHGSMVQTWRDEKGKQRKNTCDYRFDSEKKPADTWLESGGSAFGATVSEGLAMLARWMNRDLEAFASKNEQPKSDADPRTCYRRPRWYSLY